MTGPLEWLSQAPLENRKADKLIFFSAPIAIRGIQMAERDLLRAAFSAEVAERKRAVSAQFAALLAAAEQQIIAHVQGKIALIDPTLSPAARQSAIEQLIAEQAAALLQLRQDIKQQRRQARRAATSSLRGRFKKRRRRPRRASRSRAGGDEGLFRRTYVQMAKTTPRFPRDQADGPLSHAAAGIASPHHATALRIVCTFGLFWRPFWEP